MNLSIKNFTFAALALSALLFTCYFTGGAEAETTVMINTVAGSASSDPALATLKSPGGLALDTDGNLYIADTYNHLIRLINTTTGVINTIAGTGEQGYFGNGGAAPDAKLNLPEGVAIDNSTGNLKYVKLGSAPVILDDDTNVGQWSSIGVDSDGIPHVSYYDGGNADLKYVKVDAACLSNPPATCTQRILDSAGQVGSDSSMAVDSAGIPHIVYFDATNRYLKYVKLDGLSSPRTIHNRLAVGRYTAIALDPDGAPHITYYESSGLFASRLWYIRGPFATSLPPIRVDRL